MRAILIEPKHRRVRVIDIKTPDDARSIAEAIKCDYIEFATDFDYLDVQHTVYVDEEGLLDNAGEKYGWFKINGIGPFAGNGLILGLNSEGESINATIDTMEVLSSILFVEPVRVISLETTR